MTARRHAWRALALASAVATATALLAAGCSGSNEEAAAGSDGMGAMAMDQSTTAGASGSSGASAMAMRTLDETTWDGMRISVALMQPQQFTVFQGTKRELVEPEASENAHVMVVLADAETGERIPYASVWATITAPSGKTVFDERLWPMISRSMGTHYGANVSLPDEGAYAVKLVVGPPEAARHPEYAGVWLEARLVELSFDWDGSL